MTIPAHRLFGLLLIPLLLFGAWFMGVAVADGNYRVIALPVLAGIGLLAFFWIPQFLWVFAVCSVFIPGQITGLGVPVTLTEITVLFLTIRYATENILIRKQRIHLGPSPEKFFLILLMAVVCYHAIVDRMGMRLLGSEMWGGRGYLAILLGFVSYVVLQSSNLSLKVFQKLPLFVLLAGSYDFSIKIITTLFPSTIGIVNRFYFGASDAGITEAVFSGRWGFLANFGHLLLLWSFSTARISDFFGKGKFLNFVVCAIGLLFCFLSGYRSSILGAFAVLGVAAYRDLGFRAFFGILPAALALAMLSFIHTAGIYRLPDVIQRGMTFIPGDWDVHVVADAQGSLDFRSEVWQEWKERYFPKAPVLGRGIALNPDEMMATIAFTSGIDPFTGTPINALFARNEAFVISGNLHNGFYSTIDRFGLIGLLGVLGFCFTYAWKLYRHFIDNRDKPLCPPLEWLAIYTFTYTITFWPGAMRFENFFPQMMLLVGLFYTLEPAWKRSLPQAAKLTSIWDKPLPWKGVAREPLVKI